MAIPEVLPYADFEPEGLERLGGNLQIDGFERRIRGRHETHGLTWRKPSWFQDGKPFLRSGPAPACDDGCGRTSAGRREESSAIHPCILSERRP